jgi:hypothetical protein
MFVDFVSLGDPSRRMFDDGAGMHKYLLCTGIVVVPASDSKDLFVERVTMWTVQSARLIWVGLVKYHVVFPVSQMFGAEGQDATSWT